ncbi:MAG TPA: hypothetical protein EYP25_01170 [Anaerolineae bacterium]|nr:hypothetical protein [Anaerolineae bacterium]HIQ12193.1 hypothetical protein [Caldilineales bacterium]
MAVYAVGAQSDRRLHIPGEDLERSLPATQFVAWYNGHPDYARLTFHLGVERVAVIGVGNVAMDVPRITPARDADAAAEAIPRLLQARGVRYVTWQDWKRIDSAEVEAGKAQGRPRVKFTSVEAMFQVLVASGK